jgi:hypothetical protein
MVPSCSFPVVYVPMIGLLPKNGPVSMQIVFRNSFRKTGHMPTFRYVKRAQMYEIGVKRVRFKRVPL